MDHFEIKGDDGYIKITLVEIFASPNPKSPFGGWDARAEIEIKSQNYFVRGALWLTTDDIAKFHKELAACQEHLEGEAAFWHYDKALDLKVVYGDSGHIQITGEYNELGQFRTTLVFEIATDQSYIISTLNEMRSIADKYGDN